MRGFPFISATLALALSACSIPDAAAGVAGLPSSPSVVCDRGTMDEQAGTAVELGYKLFRTGVELGVDSGLVKGQRAATLDRWDGRLFAATQAVQNAYRACNAASYKAAIDDANALLKDAQAALAAK